MVNPTQKNERCIVKKLNPGNMRHSAASLAVAAAFLVSCETAAFGQSADTTQIAVTIPASSTANSADAGVAAHTNLQILGS